MGQHAIANNTVRQCLARALYIPAGSMDPPSTGEREYGVLVRLPGLVSLDRTRARTEYSVRRHGWSERFYMDPTSTSTSTTRA